MTETVMLFVLSVIKIAMSAYGYKISCLFVNGFIQYSQIAGDTDTSIARVFSVQRVIVQQRMKRIFEKNVSYLLKFFLLI